MIRDANGRFGPVPVLKPQLIDTELMNKKIAGKSPLNSVYESASKDKNRTYGRTVVLY